MSKLANIVTVLALGVALTGAAFVFARENRVLPKGAPVRSRGATDTVPALTAETFKAAAAQSKPVLVDFWATWCGPCRIQGPNVEKTAALVGDRALVGKVDVDQQRELAAQFQVRSIPTLVILKGGKEVKRFVGVTEPEVLRDALLAAAK
jgi:thioredoxin 1